MSVQTSWFSSHLRALHTIGITSICLALVACGGGSGDSSRSPSDDTPLEPNFRFVLDPEVTARASDFFINNANTFFPAALEQLNALPGLLPETVVITYRDCGIANAFYDSSDRTITICSELDNAQYNLLLELGLDSDDAFVLSDFSTAFVIDHEIGHALVDILDIPIAGNNESTADAIATVLSVERSLGGTTRPYSLFGGLSLADQPTSYGDEHGNGQDRAGDIICWTVGGRTELLFDSDVQSLVQPFVEAGRDCTAEYQDQLSAMHRWLPGFAPRLAVAKTSLDPAPPGLLDLIRHRKRAKPLQSDWLVPTATKTLHVQAQS